MVAAGWHDVVPRGAAARGAAVGAAPDVLVWSRVPMALFVGLLPVTLAGIGTRDAALVYFLAAAAGEGPALALGVLGTLRYVVPALCGLPFLGSLRRPGAGAGTAGPGPAAVPPR